MRVFSSPFDVLITINQRKDGSWCICKPDASSSALQKTIDYACGAGADCSPLLQNGPCFNPNTVAAHCSYAANSYFQRKGQAQGACDFAGTATVTQTDPSLSGCSFPASSSAAGTGSGTPSMTPSTPGSSTNPPGSSTNTPPGSGGLNPGFTPTTGTGGVIGGLGPSGTASIDGSDGGLLPNPMTASLLLTIHLFSLLLLLRI